MKKTLVLLLLVTSIQQHLYAQNKKADQWFSIPEEVVINRRFFIDLDKGNSLKIEMTDITELAAAQNIDAVLQGFLTDIAALGDSFANPLTAKRVDYLVDDKGRKKIRFQQFAPKGNSFLVNNGELAALKTEQDTICIIVAAVNAPPPQDLVSHASKRYYQYTFYLNDVKDLELLFKNNLLSEKLNSLQNNYNSSWKRVPGTDSYQLTKDNGVTANRPKGYGTRQGRDFVTLLATANIQNYKNYFVPSFSVGARFTLANSARTFKREIGLYWEPNFIFTRDAAGKLQTQRNDFVTLTFSQGGITEHDPAKPFLFSADFSLGWLQRRKGEVFDKNTFRLGIGKIQMQKTTVEPCLYFNNFFKGVTPGIRLCQYF
ncbi:MAG: hypothetical protein RL172_1100 [Bacteroidota bacterium]|jgi:hypothetical protein